MMLMRNLFGRWPAMAKLAVSMMFHDRAKLAGPLLGVMFATLLVMQQLGTLFALVSKNTQFVDNTNADLWVVPPATEQALPGAAIPMTALTEARVTEGVAWAEPLLMGSASMRRPDGGAEAVTLVGTRVPRLAGGPFHMVAGTREAIADPDTIIFEDAQRDELGGLNLGSVRELSGRRVVAGGFTYGLLPFGPGYAFGNYETVRGLLRFDSDQTSFVLVKLLPGADAEAVRDALRAKLGSGVDVYTKTQYSETISTYLIGAQLGVVFGTSTFFALIVGFVVVALSMFSAVVDSVREFGTLKAIGATNWDLTKLLVVQALLYATLGTTVGLFVVAFVAEQIRSAELSLVLPPELYFGMFGVMGSLCAAASLLAVLRVRSIEPGMVFR